MSKSNTGAPVRIKRSSFLALYEIERLKLNPIEMLATIYTKALEAYENCRGLTDKSDAGAAYLSVAGNMAAKLASFKHPTLSAVAIQDVSDDEKKRVLTTKEALKIMQADPFCPVEVSKLDLSLLPEEDKGPLPIGIKDRAIEPS